MLTLSESNRSGFYLVRASVLAPKKKIVFRLFFLPSSFCVLPLLVFGTTPSTFYFEGEIAFAISKHSYLIMGTGKKEATRKERQGKTSDGMGNVRTKGENFYRYVPKMNSGQPFSIRID